MPTLTPEELARAQSRRTTTPAYQRAVANPNYGPQENLYIAPSASVSVGPSTGNRNTGTPGGGINIPGLGYVYDPDIINAYTNLQSMGFSAANAVMVLQENGRQFDAQLAFDRWQAGQQVAIAQTQLAAARASSGADAEARMAAAQAGLEAAQYSADRALEASQLDNATKLKIAQMDNETQTRYIDAQIAAKGPGGWTERAYWMRGQQPPTAAATVTPTTPAATTPSATTPEQTQAYRNWTQATQATGKPGTAGVGSKLAQLEVPGLSVPWAGGNRGQTVAPQRTKPVVGLATGGKMVTPKTGAVQAVVGEPALTGAARPELLTVTPKATTVTPLTPTPDIGGARVPLDLVPTLVAPTPTTGWYTKPTIPQAIAPTTPPPVSIKPPVTLPVSKLPVAPTPAAAGGSTAPGIAAVTGTPTDTADKNMPWLRYLQEGTQPAQYGAWGGTQTSKLGYSIKPPHTINYNYFLQLNPDEQQMALAAWQDTYGYTPETALELMRRASFQGSGSAMVGYR